jgi:hypothetical protein
MKNGLLLTLKQLIKLGVIKLKKRRKNKNKRLQQIEAFEKGVSDAVPFNPQNKRYSNFVGSSTPPQMMPYTDNLRLRDSNDNFNTRLLEYKNDLTGQKLLLNDQQEKQRELENDVDIGRQIIMRELRPVSYDYGPSGFSYDDNIVISQTDGSETFEPQTRQQPHTAQPTRYSAIQDYEEEGIISRAEELMRRKREEENAQSFQSPFKDNLAKEENFAEDDSEPIGKPFKLSTQASDDEAETEQLTPQNPTIRIKENKKHRSTLIDRKEDNQDKISESNEDVKSMNFPKEPVPKHDNFPFSPERIPYAKSKPTVAELEQWKEWYLQMGLKDPSILQMNTRSSYIKPIQAKLLDEYKKLRGNKDPSILRSKDPRIIYKAIKQRLAGLG